MRTITALALAALAEAGVRRGINRRNFAALQQGHKHSGAQFNWLEHVSTTQRLQAAMPYGIEAFDTVLRPLWKGLLLTRSEEANASGKRPYPLSEVFASTAERAWLPF